MKEHYLFLLLLHHIFWQKPQRYYLNERLKGSPKSSRGSV